MSKLRITSQNIVRRTVSRVRTTRGPAGDYLLEPDHPPAVRTKLVPKAIMPLSSSEVAQAPLKPDAYGLLEPAPRPTNEGRRQNYNSNDLLVPAEAADVLRLSDKTLANWRSKGVGPRFHKVGGRIRYRYGDLMMQFADGEDGPECGAAP